MSIAIVRSVISLDVQWNLALGGTQCNVVSIVVNNFVKFIIFNINYLKKNNVLLVIPVCFSALHHPE